MAEYKDSPQYEEPNGDHVPLHPIVNAMVTVAKRRGPHVMEVWTCRRCRMECFCYHPFSETLTCGRCGHPTASNVPRYLSIREQRVDGQ